MDNENGNYKISVEGRLTALEVTVNEIKNNHLAHIEAKIDKMFWFILTTAVGILVELLLHFVK